MLRMGNVDGIDDSFLVEGKPLERLKQPFNAWPHVQFLPQLLHLEISVRTTFLQGINMLLLLAVGTDGIIVVGREPSVSNKLLDAPGVHQHLKQICETVAAHSVRCSRQPQELRLRPCCPQHLIGLGQRMVRLVNHHQRRGEVNVKVLRQRLYGRYHHPLEHCGPFASCNHPVVYPEVVQKRSCLLDQFYAVCHNQHRTISIPVQILLHERSKYNGFPRTGGHLHHYAAMRLECPVDLFANLYLIISQHIVKKDLF